MSDVAQILSQIEHGDPSAAEQWLPLVYEHLKKLATAKMADERTSRPATSRFNTGINSPMGLDTRIQHAKLFAYATGIAYAWCSAEYAPITNRENRWIEADGPGTT